MLRQTTDQPEWNNTPLPNVNEVSDWLIDLDLIKLLSCWLCRDMLPLKVKCQRQRKLIANKTVASTEFMPEVYGECEEFSDRKISLLELHLITILSLIISEIY